MQLQEQLEPQAEASKGSEELKYKRKGKETLKRPWWNPLEILLPPLKRAIREAIENKLKEEAQL